MCVCVGGYTERHVQWWQSVLLTNTATSKSAAMRFKRLPMSIMRARPDGKPRRHVCVGLLLFTNQRGALYLQSVQLVPTVASQWLQ